MKKILNIAFAVLAVLGLAQAAHAQGQNTYTHTTLSAAITATDKSFNVASNSGFTGVNNPDQTVGNVSNPVKMLFMVDRELIQVEGSFGTQNVTVTRGMNGTLAAAHKSGADVWLGQPSWFIYADKLGSCTETNERILPVFSINRASKQVLLYNCSFGTWVAQDVPADDPNIALAKSCDTTFGVVALASMGSSSTSVNTEQYNVSVYVSRTFLSTGALILNGSSTDTSSKRLVAVYSAAGNLVATSALAGVARSGGANGTQSIPWITPTLLSGPAYYVFAYQNDTGVANDFAALLASQIDAVNSKLTGGTFGTVLKSITTPASFSQGNLPPVTCGY